MMIKLGHADDKASQDGRLDNLGPSLTMYGSYANVKSFFNQDLYQARPERLRILGDSELLLWNLCVGQK